MKALARLLLLTLALAVPLVWVASCGPRDKLREIEGDSPGPEDARNPVVSEDYFTKLHEASKVGDRDEVYRLLTSGVEPSIRAGNKVHHGITPLHVACIGGHEPIVALLIEHGAKINAKLTTGLIPLHLAVSGNHVGIVKKLIDQGADVDSHSLFVHRPLYIAKKNGHEEIIKMLREKNAKEE